MKELKGKLVLVTGAASGIGRCLALAFAAGLFPVAGLAPHVATKYVLVGLTEVLAIEGGAHGIKAIVVCLWITRTPMVEEVASKGLSDSGKILIQRRARFLYADPEELAAQVAKAVKKNKLLFAHTPFTKIIDYFHRLTREGFLAVNRPAFRITYRLIQSERRRVRISLAKETEGYASFSRCKNKRRGYVYRLAKRRSVSVCA